MNHAQEMDQPRLAVGDTLHVEIAKIVPNGLGLAFAPGHTIFVPLAAPGDKLRVRIEQKKGSSLFAEIVEILEPGPDRIAPPCQYFGRCGGCTFQQLNYQAQLAAKKAMIEDCLTRIGKLTDVPAIEVVPSPAEFGYRSRVLWHLDPATQAVGYYRRASHDVIDIAECPIATGLINAVLARLRGDMEWENVLSDRAQIEAAHGDAGAVSLYSPDLAPPADELQLECSGFNYSYSAETFFQANHFLLEQLITEATAGRSGRTALDLYCGIGLFALPLARAFERVVGVEGSAASVHFAKKNAWAGGLSNVSFVRERVADFLNGRMPENIDLILLDPPRAGTEKNVIYRILKIRPKAISYVACEPSVLARDLRKLLDGGYRIESIKAFDMFPQTHHVETVVRLS